MIFRLEIYGESLLNHYLEENMRYYSHLIRYALDPIYERPAISKALSLYKLVLKLQTADQASSFWECK